MMKHVKSVRKVLQSLVVENVIHFVVQIALEQTTVLSAEIKFCSKCGEYIMQSGECSNPGCPDPILELGDSDEDN